jgi:hypothetical protein
MWARVASFDGGDFERLRELSEERMASGTMGMPEGVRRVLVCADRDAGRRLFVTFFDSREAIRAAAERGSSRWEMRSRTTSGVAGPRSTCTRSSSTSRCSPRARGDMDAKVAAPRRDR